MHDDTHHLWRKKSGGGKDLVFDSGFGTVGARVQQERLRSGSGGAPGSGAWAKGVSSKIAPPKAGVRLIGTASGSSWTQPKPQKQKQQPSAFGGGGGGKKAIGKGSGQDAFEVFELFPTASKPTASSSSRQAGHTEAWPAPAAPVAEWAEVPTKTNGSGGSKQKKGSSSGGGSGSAVPGANFVPSKPKKKSGTKKKKKKKVPNRQSSSSSSDDEFGDVQEDELAPAPTSTPPPPVAPVATAAAASATAEKNQRLMRLMRSATNGGDAGRMGEAREFSMLFKHGDLSADEYVSAIAQESVFGEVGFDSLADDLASLLKQPKRREDLRHAIAEWRRRRRSGGGQEEAAAVEADWTCGACTFENPGEELKCGMCGVEAGVVGRAGLKNVGSVVRSLR